MIVTVDEARQHCRAEDGDTVLPYLLAGIDSAEAFLNRRVFETQDALDMAIEAIPAELAAADDAYEDAVAAAEELEGYAREAALCAARDARTNARLFADRTYDGIVVNSSIKAAVLLTTGKLFLLREDAITGDNVTPLPGGSQSLLWPYRSGVGV